MAIKVQRNSTHLRQHRALLVVFASWASGCGKGLPPQVAPFGGPGTASASNAPSGAAPAAALKICGSRSDFALRDQDTWVEDARQKLCCSPRAHGAAWTYVAPEACLSRYAPGLRLPYLVVADSVTPGAEQREAEACIPGVAAEVLIPTAEFEARLDSGSRLRIESCVGSSCARAVVAFDDLARNDQLLFALEGSSQAGANLLWSAGEVRLRVRVAQPREQVVEGARYRLILELDRKPLRTIDTALSYAVASAPAAACPLAQVALSTP